jgi:uncharacterized protein YkwD
MKATITTVLYTILFLPLGAFGQIVEDTDADRVSAEARPIRQAESPDLEQATSGIVEGTNLFRRDQGLKPVQVNPKLTEAAQYFADYMARNDRYGHTADGKRPSQRAAEHDYEYCLVAENIAYQFSTHHINPDDLVETFLEGWKQSPEHRKNLLEEAATETGVAISQSEESGYYYAVQMFGRPRSEMIEFQIANRSDADIEYRIGEQTYPLPPRYTRTHQRCREGEVTFHWPEDANPKKEIMSPSNGESLIIVPDGIGGFRVTR